MREGVYAEHDRVQLLTRLERRVEFIKRLHPNCPIVARLRAWVWVVGEGFACEVSSRPSGPYVEVRLQPQDDVQFVADQWLSLYKTWLETTNNK